MQYGKEKVAYYASTFLGWEKTYNICRQFCINLTELHPLSVELKERFFQGGKNIKRFAPPINPVFRVIKYVLDKLINKTPSF